MKRFFPRRTVFLAVPLAAALVCGCGTDAREDVREGEGLREGAEVAEEADVSAVRPDSLRRRRTRAAMVARARSLGLDTAVVTPPRGALSAFRLLGAGLVGRMRLGRHAERYFVLTVVHPPEYGDGFGPRAAEFERSWLWSDSGDPLVPGEGPA